MTDNSSTNEVTKVNTTTNPPEQVDIIPLQPVSSDPVSLLPSTSVPTKPDSDPEHGSGSVQNKLITSKSTDSESKLSVHPPEEISPPLPQIPKLKASPDPDKKWKWISSCNQIPQGPENYKHWINSAPIPGGVVQAKISLRSKFTDPIKLQGALDEFSPWINDFRIWNMEKKKKWSSGRVLPQNVHHPAITFTTPLHNVLIPLHSPNSRNPANLENVYQCCKLLLEAGANPNVFSNQININNDNPTLRNGNSVQTPFHIVLRCGEPRLIDLFLHHGGNPILPDGVNTNPFLLALVGYQAKTSRDVDDIIAKGFLPQLPSPPLLDGSNPSKNDLPLVFEIENPHVPAASWTILFYQQYSKQNLFANTLFSLPVPVFHRVRFMIDFWSLYEDNKDSLWALGRSTRRIEYAKYFIERKEKPWTQNEGKYSHHYFMSWSDFHRASLDLGEFLPYFHDLVDVPPNYDIDIFGCKGHSLHQACRHGKVSAIEYYLEQGLDISAVNRYHETPITIMIRHHPELLTPELQEKLTPPGKGWKLQLKLWSLPILQFMDFFTDIAVSIQYFNTGDTIWGSLVLVFLAFGIISTWLTTRETHYPNKWVKYISHLLQLHVWFAARESYLQRSPTVESVLSKTSEAVFESAPQLLLQTYIVLVVSSNVTFFSIASIVFSLFSLTQAVVAWIEFIEPTLSQGRTRDSQYGIPLALVIFIVTVARFFILAFFALFYKVWIFGFLLFSWFFHFLITYFREQAFVDDLIAYRHFGMYMVNWGLYNILYGFITSFCPGSPGTSHDEMRMLKLIEQTLLFILVVVSPILIPAQPLVVPLYFYIAGPILLFAHAFVVYDEGLHRY